MEIKISETVKVYFRLYEKVDLTDTRVDQSFIPTGSVNQQSERDLNLKLRLIEIKNNELRIGIYLTYTIWFFI